jgi:hypothetical protein
MRGRLSDPANSITRLGVVAVWKQEGNRPIFLVGHARQFCHKDVFRGGAGKVIGCFLVALQK